MNGTDSKIDTPVARGSSAPVLYELIDRDGNHVRLSRSIQTLADVAREKFPDQEQDPDRTGKGWDIQVCA